MDKGICGENIFLCSKALMSSLPYGCYILYIIYLCIKYNHLIHRITERTSYIDHMKIDSPVTSFLDSINSGNYLRLPPVLN